MKEKAASGIMLTLLLVSMMYAVFNVPVVVAWTGTATIKPDGSVDPPTAPIQRNGDLYTLTDNITSNADGIVIQRNNMTLDGAGYTVRGVGSGRGIDMSGTRNITIKNVEIKSFGYGFYLFVSSNNSIVDNNIRANNVYGIYLRNSSTSYIVGNNLTNNGEGIDFYESSYNTISGNNITNNSYGIYLHASFYINISGNIVNSGLFGVLVAMAGPGLSDHIRISGNNIRANYWGVAVASSSYNTVSGNNITNNSLGILVASPGGLPSKYNNISGNYITANTQFGIEFAATYNNTVSGNDIAKNANGIRVSGSSNNSISHNNFLGNTLQVNSTNSLNIWDDGYPSGGNYWSDYAGVDLFSGPNQNIPGSDGIGDVAYVIDVNNQDRYPIYGGAYHDIGITSITLSKTVVGQGYNLSIGVKIVNYGISAEAFNVTVYGNVTVLASLTNVAVTGLNSVTVTFTWNTTGFAKGNYTISAYATPVSGETYVADNTLIDGWVIVAMAGDIIPDGIIDIFDLVAVGNHFGHSPPDGHTPSDPEYTTCFNADVNGDGVIDIFDLVAVGSRFGEIDP